MYDNQGAEPNTTAPGADRNRINLTLTRSSDVTGTQNFVFYCSIVAGEILEQVTGTDNYSTIGDALALRTREESGNYLVNPFRLSLQADSAGASSNLIANVSSGTAYINGYRCEKNNPSQNWKPHRNRNQNPPLVSQLFRAPPQRLKTEPVNNHKCYLQVLRIPARISPKTH